MLPQSCSECFSFVTVSTPSRSTVPAFFPASFLCSSGRQKRGGDLQIQALKDLQRLALHVCMCMSFQPGLSPPPRPSFSLTPPHAFPPLRAGTDVSRSLSNCLLIARATGELAVDPTELRQAGENKDEAMGEIKSAPTGSQNWRGRIHIMGGGERKGEGESGRQGGG